MATKLDEAVAAVRRLPVAEQERVAIWLLDVLQHGQFAEPPTTPPAYAAPVQPTTFEELGTWIGDDINVEFTLDTTALADPRVAAWYTMPQPGEDPRAGWEEQFRLMAERGDDRLFADWPATLSAWDEDEWAW